MNHERARYEVCQSVHSKTLGNSSTVHDAAAEGKPSLLREVGVDGTAFASAEKDEVRERGRVWWARAQLLVVNFL